MLRQGLSVSCDLIHQYKPRQDFRTNGATPMGFEESCDRLSVAGVDLDEGILRMRPIPGLMRQKYMQYTRSVHRNRFLSREHHSSLE